MGSSSSGARISGGNAGAEQRQFIDQVIADEGLAPTGGERGQLINRLADIGGREGAAALSTQRIRQEARDIIG